MAQQIINIGTSANKGNGDAIRVAFDKTNKNFTELYQEIADIQNGTITLTGSVTGDVVGSVFADDSTILVDAPAGVIKGPVNNASVVTNSLTANNIVGDVTGDLTGDVTGTLTGSLVGNSTGYHIGDVTGSVFADDSTVMIDSVSQTINLNGTINNHVIPTADEVFDIGSSTNRFRDIYLKGSTIDLGGLKLQNSGGLSLGLDLIGGEAFGAGWWDTQWFVVGPKTGGPEIKVRIDDTPSDADNQAWIDFLKNIQPGDTFTIQTPVQQTLTVTSTVTEDHFTSTKFRFYFGVDVAPSIVGNDTYVYKVSTTVSPSSNLKVKYTPTTPTDWGYGTTPSNVSSALDLLADWITNRDIANITGSVFGDDSTLLVDGVNSVIPSANLSGALPAIDGSALTGIVITETDPIVGAITGLVKADGAGNISAAVAGTDYLATETIDLATLKATVAASADFADFQTRIAAL